MTAARDEVLAVFADLAEEDPTVLRDLLLRIARWERQLPSWWVATPWRQVTGVPDVQIWNRDSVRIGRTDRSVARVEHSGAGSWKASVYSERGSPPDERPFTSREAAMLWVDDVLRRHGWTLPEDSGAVLVGDPAAAPICTCTGPARDAHDRGCPVRLAHPRVDLGDPP